MTDKQIIIDEMIEEIGFNVQQCGYLEIIEDAPNYPEIGGTYTAFECNLYCRDCKFIDDCRYKQLLRKEQECEGLKIQIKEHNDDMFKNPPEKRFYCKGCTLPYISKKLKKTLTEIKEIAEKQCVCGVDCIDIKQILQKISECEVER
jgi:hypothetical protein